MSTPNISFRQKSPKRFVVPILLLIVAIGGALVYIGSRGSATKKKAEEKTPQVAFTVSAFQAYSEGNAVPAATSQPERDALVGFFTDYYQTAFVDPKKWTDPQFTVLKSSFTADAQASFTRDLNTLTIGEGRTDFRRVEPGATTLRMAVYYDKAGKVQFAVATVRFVARATTQARRPVDVTQTATYRLQKGTAGWQIFSYEAKASQDTPSPSPTASPTPS